MQAVIGLPVTKEVIPIKSWVWPGNTQDISVVDKVKDDLVGWKLGRVISVMDSGFASDDNLKYLQRAGGHYIVGEKLCSAKKEIKETLARPGRYKEVKDNLHVKEILVGDGSARSRYILAYNPKETERQKQERQEIVDNIKEQLKSLRQLEGKAHMEASDVALGYKQQVDIENAFSILKQDLSIRPVYHRLEKRIKAHVLLNWSALLLIRIMENKTDMTWNNLKHELNKIQIGKFILLK